MPLILEVFPKLRDSSFFAVTSPPDERYNCIAWAAQDTTRFWWPDRMRTAYWPPGAEREETLEAFVAAFATLGYEVCESIEVEADFQRIAIYAVGDRPTHAARQLANGSWTSKLGRSEDVQHSLADLEGRLYGQAVRIVRRRRLI
jgi:hypothetical protein